NLGGAAWFNLDGQDRYRHRYVIFDGVDPIARSSKSVLMRLCKGWSPSPFSRGGVSSRILRSPALPSGWIFVT
ncbi:17189_t:CDS:2, partial [Acaulospora morrowiae]